MKSYDRLPRFFQRIRALQFGPPTASLERLSTPSQQPVWQPVVGVALGGGVRVDYAAHRSARSSAHPRTWRLSP